MSIVVKLAHVMHGRTRMDGKMARSTKSKVSRSANKQLKWSAAAADVSISPADKASASAQRIHLPAGGSVQTVLKDARVKSGQRVSASLSVKSVDASEAKIRVLLIRNLPLGVDCYFKEFVKTAATPVLVEVGGVSPASYSSFRLEVKNVGEHPADVIVGTPTAKVA